jgi:hypothetical protein
MKVRSFWKVVINNWESAEKLEEVDYSDIEWTNIRPPDTAIKYKLPCEFIDGAWVIDETSSEGLLKYRQDRLIGTKEQPLKYAPNGDQLDMIYHWLESFLTEEQKESCPFYLNNYAVKEAHKKPT